MRKRHVNKRVKIPKKTKRGGFGSQDSPLSNLQPGLIDAIISDLDVRSLINVTKTNIVLKDKLQPTLEDIKSKYDDINRKLNILLSSIPERQPFEFEEVLELETLLNNISELHDSLDNCQVQAWYLRLEFTVRLLTIYGSFAVIRLYGPFTAHLRLAVCHSATY